MPDHPETRSKDAIAEDISSLIREYCEAHDPDGSPPLISAFHVVAEAVYPCGCRHRIEIGDRQSSRHTSMGLLFAALHDPDWLDRKRMHSHHDDSDGD